MKEDRSRELGLLAERWNRAHGPEEDPDDEPQFVAAARRIMGLPPLTSDSPNAVWDRGAGRPGTARNWMPASEEAP